MMSEHLIEIEMLIRRLRGESQAMMVQANDRRFYVAKLAGNPKGTRSLVNEWASHLLLRQLAVCTPPMRILRLTPDARSYQQFYFSHGDCKKAIRDSLHLGSQIPVEPRANAIWDSLPRKLLARIVNQSDFATVLVYDFWTHTMAPRQAIFVREPEEQGSESRFRAHFVDHSRTLAAGQWEMPQRSHCTYIDEGIYDLLPMRNLCETAISRIEDLKQADLCSTVDNIPTSWFKPGEQNIFQKFLKALSQSRRHLRKEFAATLEAYSGNPPAA